MDLPRLCKGLQKLTWADQTKRTPKRRTPLSPRLTAPSVLLAVAAFALSAGLSQVDAKDIACGPDEVSVPDDRAEGGNLCISKAEWEKAKKNCSANAPAGEEVDPTGCLCQDGDEVGACGD